MCECERERRPFSWTTSVAMIALGLATGATITNCFQTIRLNEHSAEIQQLKDGPNHTDRLVGIERP